MKRPFQRKSSQEADAIASDWILRRERGLSADEAKTLEAWVAADPEHALALERHEQAWSYLDRPVHSGRRRELAWDLERRARSRQRRRRWASLAVAGVVGCIAAAWLIRPPGVPDGPVVASNGVVIRPTVETLPDGTRVSLKDGAEIQIDYTSEVRRVWLKTGEALFDVEKAPSRPFVVVAGKIEVRAIGTIFLVDTARESIVDVIVTEGTVAIGRRENESSSVVSPPEDAEPPTLVGAGRRVVVDLQPSVPSFVTSDVTAAELASKFSWQAVRLDFSYTPLGTAVGLFNQHAPVQLVVADPELENLKVSGRFRADNTEALVRLLEANFGVKIERRQDRIHLHKAD